MWIRPPLNFRGETGAQSSVIPTIVAFLKVPHQSVDADRPPGRHAQVHAGRATVPSSSRSRRCPDIRDKVEKEPFNDALEALASFRETHLQFAIRYIAAHERDPRGTGGTPYMRLAQPVDRRDPSVQDSVTRGAGDKEPNRDLPIGSEQPTPLPPGRLSFRVEAAGDERMSSVWRVSPVTVLETKLEGLPMRRGKVRDVYDLGRAAAPGRHGSHQRV